MTKRSDMGSRYAAAHARREQRRASTTSREYLPLAEEAVVPEAGTGGALAGMGLGRGANPAVVSRLPPIDYSYLRGDLRRIAILTAVLFGGMIILSILVHV